VLPAAVWQKIGVGYIFFNFIKFRRYQTTAHKKTSDTLNSTHENYCSARDLMQTVLFQ